MSWFDSLLGIVDDIAGNGNQVTKKLRESRAYLHGLSKTMDERGVFNTLSGGAQDSLRENMTNSFRSEYMKPYYDMWLELKDDCTFSPALARLIWALNQPEENRDYHYREAVVRLSLESPDITRKSYEHLKNFYAKLYELYKKTIDTLVEKQTELHDYFISLSEEEKLHWIESGEWKE